MAGLLIAICGLVGFGITVLTIPLILKVCNRCEVNRFRDLHHSQKVPVPRFGGLALAVAFGGLELFMHVFLPEWRAALAVRPVVVWGSLAMFALGFADDLRPLGAKRKLLAQLLIAGFVYWSGVGIETVKIPFSDRVVQLHAWGGLVTVLWLVGITNLVNLIDGVDGLAGGIGLMLMTLLVYVGYQSGSFVFLAAGMSGALLGFLMFNFPPAKIYLGDGGAYFIGFQIGAFSLVNSHKGAVVAALTAPLFVLALPIVDTSLAILRRGLHGLPVFRPDRRHLHHQMLRTGMSRRQVVLSFYAVTLVCLVMGFAAFWSRGHLVPVLLGALVLILLFCAGRLSFAREWFAVGRTLGNSLAMRQEIQYALSLTAWLRQEANRCRGLDELFDCLVFAARRLGFLGLKLTLGDEERAWTEPGEEPAMHHCLVTRHEMDGGRLGVIELRASRCGSAGGGMEGRPVGLHGCQASACPCVAESRLFEIMSELLAEAWMKGARKWVAAEATLRFDAVRPEAASRRETPLQSRRVVAGAGRVVRSSSKRIATLDDGSLAG